MEAAAGELQRRTGRWDCGDGGGRGAQEKGPDRWRLW